MATVARLLTLVDIDDAHDPGPEARTMSVGVRHEAVLRDGRRIVLLEGRGWTATLMTTGEVEPGSPGIWAFETVEEIERSARDVVGPDEPFGDHSPADMEATHWQALARTLQAHGVEVAATALAALPHEVELSARVRARIGRGSPLTGPA